MKRNVLRAMTVLALSLALAFIGCGGSSGGGGGGGGGGFKNAFPLSATMGPNSRVLEPEEILLATPSSNFFIFTNPDAVAAGIIEQVVNSTTPGGTTTTFTPHDLILDGFDLGLLMGDIAADVNVSAANTCQELDNDLAARTGDATCYEILDCFITSDNKGEATIRFITPACSYSLTGNNSIGKITVRGKIMKEQLYPGYNNACLTPNDPTKCSDVKIAVISENFGVSGGEVFTAKSVISGYITNYDLDDATPPSLSSLPLFITANMQVDGMNMALAIGMPAGFGNTANTYYGGIIDDDGLIYGLGYNAAGTQIVLVTLPIQADGQLCYSIFDDTGATWTLNAGSDTCGLTPGLVVDELGNVI